MTGILRHHDSQMWNENKSIRLAIYLKTSLVILAAYFHCACAEIATHQLPVKILTLSMDVLTLVSYKKLKKIGYFGDRLLL